MRQNANQKGEVHSTTLDTMGQVPTKPLDGINEPSATNTHVLLSYAAQVPNHDITNLPDLSPFPRRMDLQSAASASRVATVNISRKKSTAARTISTRSRHKSKKNKLPIVFNRSTDIGNPGAGTALAASAKKPASLVYRKAGVQISAGVFQKQHTSTAPVLPSSLIAASTAPSEPPSYSSTACANTPDFSSQLCVLPAISTVIIPRIELVESSPLLVQRSSHASISATTPTASPTMPAFAPTSSATVSEAKSLGIVNIPSTMERPIKEKSIEATHGQQDSEVLRPVVPKRLSLPLPGTPFAANTTFEKAVLLVMPEPGLLEAAPAVRSSDRNIVPICDNHVTDSATSYDSDDSATSVLSGNTAVTQEIRILRVVNPDARLPSATSSEDEEASSAHPVTATVSTVATGFSVAPIPPVSLAVKRQVSTPPASILVVPRTSVKTQDRAQPSPITPTSATSSSPTSSRSIATTPSTAPTSLPPSPIKGGQDERVRKRDSYLNAGLGVGISPTVPSRAPVLPTHFHDPFEGLDAFAASFGISSHPILEPSPLSSARIPAVKVRSVSATTSSPAHRSSLGGSAAAAATKGREERRHASYTTSGTNRNRSHSHSSSDGDRSAACSSTSGLTGSSGKAGQNATKAKREKTGTRKKRHSSLGGRGSKCVSRDDAELGVLPHPQKGLPCQLRKVSAPPALISLNLDNDSSKRRATSVSLEVPCCYMPPRSPRPPTTPLLGTHFDAVPYADHTDLTEEPAEELKIKDTGPARRSAKASNLAPIVIPPPILPSIQSSAQIDWDMTDLLLRCGISPTATNMVIPRSPSVQLETTKEAISLQEKMHQGNHPAALRPRTSFSGPLASPLPHPSSSAAWPISTEAITATATLPSAQPESARSSTTLRPARLAPPVPVDSTKPLSKYPEALPLSRKSHASSNADVNDSLTARYEAFRQLAQMAVDEPYNPFLDANGAVRLGEYKRGQNDREIWKWLKGVQRVKREGRMLRKDER